MQRQEAAAQAVADAEEELAVLRTRTSGGVPQVEATVASEALSLLELPETQPLCSTVGNKVLPEKLLAGMRSLREALEADGAPVGEEVTQEDDSDNEHVDTADEFEPGRSTRRTGAKRRAHSANVGVRKRSSSRTPPPVNRKHD